MPTMLMESSTKTPQSSKRREPTVDQIIAAARAKPVRAAAKGAWLLSGLSAILLWASFTPLDWGWLGWIALVPLILLVRIPSRTRRMYFAVYATGLAGTLASLQWMRLGHPTMYTAWLALSIYMALYFPAFVLLSRTAVHRLRLPLTIAVPTVWVGLEFLRAHLMTGFAWYYLGHTQYRWVELIQICDLIGAYGVSFVVAAASAALAGVLPESLFSRLKLLPPGTTDLPAPNSRWRHTWLPVAFSIGLVCASVTYGYIRRAQGEFREGPRVALIQCNYPTSVKQDPSQAVEVFYRHYFLTGQSVRFQPDVVVWPETMYRSPLLVVEPGVTDEQLRKMAPGLPLEAWKDPQVSKALANLSQQAGAAAIVGVEAGVATPDGVRQYNSAVFSTPTEGIRGRYDKMHRVVFGEYIPFRERLPWLHAFTPFSSGFGIDRGERAVAFAHGGWRFSPIICFEDTVPHLVRGIVSATADPAQSGKHVDCLVNLTNDGWFHGSSELDQHLITALFRCVENRTPMVRAVNTGISAVIDGDGVVVEPEVMLDGRVLMEARQEAAEARKAELEAAVKQDPDHATDPFEKAANIEQAAFERARITMRDPATGRWRKQLDAVLVDDVPLDNRTSLYVLWGDWFAATCFFAATCVFLAGFVPRRSKA